jgi:glycosyltransferase involved in cell wall biosynthesis
MTLSIVICTRNGASRIGDALACVGKQASVDPGSYEVIVVDNGSTDNTGIRAMDAAKSLGCRTILLKESREGKISALLCGIAAAGSPLISVIDDDNLIEEYFVYRTLDLLRAFPEVGMVGSVNTLYADDPPAWFRLTAARYGCGEPWLDGEVRRIDEFRTIASRGVVAGAGSTFRKHVLETALAKGFTFMNDIFRGRNMAVTGEDTELCCLFQRLGYWFGADRRIALRHKIEPSRLNWRYARKLYRSTGAGGLAVDAFAQLADESMSSRWKYARATWWWMAARRLRRMAALSPAMFKALVSRRKIDPVWLKWEEQSGALLRVLHERGGYTKRICGMWNSEWAALRRPSGDRYENAMVCISASETSRTQS